ncbi:MAG: hypothetical protein FJ027_22895 [Candidatus Rokubacteria bacterium]|nr:hypothetical protein [Candidatus Rokubacteria bacterium]
MISENFPVAGAGPVRMRELVLLAFDREITAKAAHAEATRQGLREPSWEDALQFGVQHPDVQRERPIVFLHEPWVGYFGRRDVIVLWDNAGRRELGLDGFDDPFPARYWFAFVRPPG